MITRSVTVKGRRLKVDGLGFPTFDFQLSTFDHGRRAFSLVELMFSILILGVGLVAVASLFPVASTIQQETMDQVLAMQAARNVEQTLSVPGVWASRGIDGQWLTNNTPPTSINGAFVQVPAATLNAAWPIEDRRFASTDPANRCFYWTPLFRRTNPNPLVNEWEAYIFILKGTDEFQAINIPTYQADRNIDLRNRPVEIGEYVVYPFDQAAWIAAGRPPRAMKVPAEELNPQRYLAYGRGPLPGLIKLSPLDGGVPPVNVP